MHINRVANYSESALLKIALINVENGSIILDFHVFLSTTDGK